MCREFHDLCIGSSAERALPVMICCIACLDEHDRASTSQILDVSATAEVTAARFCHLDENRDQACKIIDSLMEDVTTVRVEVWLIMDRQADLE